MRYNLRVYEDGLRALDYSSKTKSGAYQKMISLEKMYGNDDRPCSKAKIHYNDKETGESHIVIFEEDSICCDGVSVGNQFYEKIHKWFYGRETMKEQEKC